MVQDVKNGVETFFLALQLVLRRPVLRSWYKRRLFQSVFVGSLLLVFFALMLALGFWFLFDQFIGTLLNTWLSSVAGALLGVLWLLVLYFTAGPMTLLFLDLFLANTVDWEALSKELDIAFEEIQGDEKFVKAQAKGVLRTLKLSVVVLVGSLLGLIPFLSFCPFLIASYALGSDAAANVDDLVKTQKRNKQKFGFYLGLGFIPALFATIPIFGVLTLPILQVASLVRYSHLRNDGET